MRNRTVLYHQNGRYRSGIARFLCALFLLLGVSAVPAVSQPVELGEIAQLSRSGAGELALALLDQGQPDPATQAAEWMRWERLRIRILEEGRQWRVLEQRLAHVPDGLPREFVEWVWLRRAIALVHSGEYAASRQLLRALLGHDPARRETAQIAEYRRWLMQGYLQEGRTTDAFAAMLRYQQDYGEGDQEALLLRARVLLAADRAGEARAVLARSPEHSAGGVLAQLAALRSGEAPGTVLAGLRALQAKQGKDPSLAYLLSGSIAEAAAAANDTAARVLALQRHLVHPSVDPLYDGLFDLDGDALWRAWLDHAGRLGNQEQLLIGDDAAWFAAAEQTEARYPVRRHSLYAMLALRGGTAEYREKAHRHLAGLLVEADQAQGMLLLQQLYLNAPTLMPLDRVPEGIAHILVDRAIREGNLRQASALMQHLAEPPGGTARFAWQLRRAKVFILAADFAAFQRLIEGILPELPRLNNEQRDQLIQLLFDLQNVGEHELAYRLLAEIYQQVPIQELRRELLFWMADSRAAQQRHVDAARLYLQSATLGDINSMDPWAQTARYNAANSLAEAGLLQDARYIYQQLLRITDSPERRTVLLRELERIQMRMVASEQ